MKTTNVFLIFSGLKWQELCEFFRREAGFILFMTIFISPVFASVVILNTNITSMALLFFAFYFQYLTVAFIAILAILAICMLIHSFCKFIASNWRMAKKIAAERKAQT